ncbi:MAG: hypothetical protein KAW02_06745 [candidate division Zixibacteria bacterium]|nr:hypothetical protein [candidate division Zixibacteria bacterium]
MMWLNSKAFGDHRFFLLKQILLFSVILCFLVVFNLSFADELIDPGSPDWEHPWDDACNTEVEQNPEDPLETDDWLMFQFGFGSWIIIHLKSAGQQDGFGEEKAFGPSEKNRGTLLILIK